MVVMVVCVCVGGSFVPRCLMLVNTHSDEHRRGFRSLSSKPLPLNRRRGGAGEGCQVVGEVGVVRVHTCIARSFPNCVVVTVQYIKYASHKSHA